MKAIRNNVLLRLTFSESVIALPDIADATNREERQVESIKVFSVGDDVKSLKAGDEVILPLFMLKDTRALPALYKKRDKKNEGFIACKEEDIIGKY